MPFTCPVAANNEKQPLLFAVLSYPRRRGKWSCGERRDREEDEDIEGEGEDMWQRESDGDEEKAGNS